MPFLSFLYFARRQLPIGANSRYATLCISMFFPDGDGDLSVTKPIYRYPQILSLSLLLLLALFAMPASAQPPADAASDAADPTPASAPEEAPTDNPVPPSDDSTASSADAPLQQAIAPRRAQTQAIATLFDNNPTWSAHDGWLKAVAEHSTKGRAAWNNRLCEEAFDGATQFQNLRGANRLDRPSAQIEAEVLLDGAAQCTQPGYIELAMRSVSHALPHMREGLTMPGMRDALVRLAAADKIMRLQKTDTRLVLPYVDALLHVRDYAAVERVTDLKIESNPSVGKEQLEAANGRAKRANQYTLPVNAPKDCRPMLNEEHIGSSKVDIREGTHNVGCEGEGSRLQYYDGESTALFD